MESWGFKASGHRVEKSHSPLHIQNLESHTPPYRSETGVRVHAGRQDSFVHVDLEGGGETQHAAGTAARFPVISLPTLSPRIGH